VVNGTALNSGPLSLPGFDQGFLPPNDLGPDYRRRRRLLAVVAVVLLLAGVTGALFAFGLGSHHSPNGRPGSPHVTQPSSGSSKSHSSGSLTPQQPGTSQPGSGGQPGPGGQIPGEPGPTSSSPPSMTPQAVVLAYFAAISNKNWQQAWQLGGVNLYPSLAVMETDLGDVLSETVTVLSVSFDTVVVQLTTDLSTGRNPTQDYTIVVENGAIVSQAVVPPKRSPPATTPSPSASATS
jgi:hypothetical protein